MFFKIPFYNPQIGIKDFVLSFFLKSPEEKLESDLKKCFSFRNILLLKSARQGIKIILESLNLRENDEVILPAFICQVVPEAVKMAGGKPVFCDTEKDGFNIDIESAKKLISSKTKAVILAYVFGIPSRADEFAELCKNNGIVLIEDCAQSFGAKYQNKLLGTFGDFAVFSFGISKNIGGLGGGFLCCNNNEYFPKIKESVLRTKKLPFSFKKYAEFFLISLFFNQYFYWLLFPFMEGYGKVRREKENNNEYVFSMSNLEAKIALLKLRRYEKIVKERNKNILAYQQELKNSFSFPKILSGATPAFPYFPVLSPKKTFDILTAKNIPVRRLGFLNEEDKDYFLLPLNYASKQIFKIINEIKGVLDKNGQ